MYCTAPNEPLLIHPLNVQDFLSPEISGVLDRYKEESLLNLSDLEVEYSAVTIGSISVWLFGKKNGSSAKIPKLLVVNIGNNYYLSALAFILNYLANAYLKGVSANATYKYNPPFKQ
jgi:hypothetical protein